MNRYQQMKKDYLRGWHTWNVRSVLSHILMPRGLALNIALKEYQTGGYLKETLIGRFGTDENPRDVEKAYPGIHCFDDSYSEMTVEWRDITFKVETAVENDDLCILVSPVKQQLRPAMLVLECGFLWGRPGYLEKVASGLVAHFPDGETLSISTTSKKEMFDPNIPVQSSFLSVSFDETVAFFTGAPLTLEQVQNRIARHRSAALSKAAACRDLRDLYEAVECAVSWDTIYDAKNDRVISPVSRLWSIGSGGYVLFCWDNFFAGFMASLGCKELAYSNLYEILSEHTDAGFVPNLAYATGQKSEDRSQPPVGSAMLLETYRIYREKWIVEEMYPNLLRWNQWFAENRMNDSGALCWGSNKCPVLYGNQWESLGVNDRYGAALESGLDNSPMYDDIPMDRENNRLLLEDVGLTGLYILDCRSLIQLSRLLCKTEDEKALQARLDRAEAGLEGLWDEENGFYYNRRTDTGAFSRRISPTNFYALFSGRVSASRARRMADEHYYNRDEFYGDWMLPSIARNDPAYGEQDYWRGRVWAPLNFLVYLALTGTGLSDVRADLAEKSRKLFMKEWLEHRHVHENYNSITGEGCDVKNSDKFYHWGALLCVIGLAEGGQIPGFGSGLNTE